MEYTEYDYSKLRGRIVEKYGTCSNFAKALGLSERTVSVKLNNLKDWKQGEIDKTCSLLEIPIGECAPYFFKHKVQ